MKVSEICECLGLQLLAGAKGMEREVNGGYSADLISDVMGRAREGQIWITLQTHRNAVAVATLKDLAGIILVNGHLGDKDMLEQADTDDLPVMVSELPGFEVAGKLYNLLKK